MTYWLLTKEKAQTFVHTIRLGSQETCLPSCNPFRISTSSSAIVKSNTYGNAYIVNIMNIERIRRVSIISVWSRIFLFFFILLEITLHFVTDKHHSIKLTSSTWPFAVFVTHFHLQTLLRWFCSTLASSKAARQWQHQSCF